MRVEIDDPFPIIYRGFRKINFALSQCSCCLSSSDSSSRSESLISR